MTTHHLQTWYDKQILVTVATPTKPHGWPINVGRYETLAAIQDGCATLEDISERVGVSLGAVAARVGTLEGHGLVCSDMVGDGRRKPNSIRLTQQGIDVLTVAQEDYEALLSEQGVMDGETGTEIAQ